jgi:nicotinamide-nucleotide amidase
MVDDRKLTALAKQVAERLKAGNCRIVLAESCTGGLVSALLTRIPGISQYHCGSAVVYQVATKTSWLGVPRSLLKNRGPVSPEVASEMAIGALQKTPQADVAAAVTGHLGPGAPPAQDGLVYLAFARRLGKSRRPEVTVNKVELAKERGDGLKDPQRRRLRRQRSASAHLLSWILKGLEIHE